ncbi:ABC transporter ATP-binding protein [Candidatus Woesearchaeota archaeon]|nr:MAG: ABC transporter ATP-binding protein [Candidatus Woesearchaeota archaeon]
MGDAIFRVKHVSKCFGRHEVLKDINFDVERGEIIGLIGASGSGKTTLLNVVVGFLLPSKGKVEFRCQMGNKEVFLSVHDHTDVLKSFCGFASQEPSFYPKLTVRENLEYFGSLYNLSKDVLRKNTETLLHLMDLQKAQHLLAGKISGGMERRLDIACSLVHDPDVLILDEPTADLDPVLRDHIWEIVRKVNAKGTTVILASHHLAELENFCSRILILRKGKILDLDTPLHLKAKYQRHQQIHLESYPGNYDKLIPLIKSKEITRVEQKGATLVIHTDQPQRVLEDVLKIVRQHKETLVDVRLWKPSLDDVFLQLYRGVAK